jgi:hypothetical protein
MFEVSKVMFAARVVVGIEAVERLHLLGDFYRGHQVEIANAARHQLPAEAQACRVAAAGRSAEAVV